MRARNRGAVSIVFAILLLTVVGAAVTALVTMTAAEVADSNLGAEDMAPLFLAESAVEYAVARYVGGSACDATLNTTQPLGNGTFTLTFVALNAATAMCSITATGKVTASNASRRLAVDLRNTVDGIALSENFAYADAAALSAVWAETVSATKGYSDVGLITNTADGSKSLYFTTNPGGAGGAPDKFIGYREQAVTPFTTGTGLNVAVNLAYRKQDAGAGNSNLIGIDLVDTANTAVTLWSDNTRNTAGWVPANLNVALPAGRIFNRVRVTVNLAEKQRKQIQAWIDDIVITSPGGVGQAKFVVNWSETVQ